MCIHVYIHTHTGKCARSHPSKKKEAPLQKKMQTQKNGHLRTKKGGGGGGERGKTYMVATHTHKHMEKWASLKKKRRGKTGEYVHGSHGASCPHKKRI